MRRMTSGDMKMLWVVLAHAIAFRPTFVIVQATNLVAGRLYILLLIGDRDGEEAMNSLAADSEPNSVVP